MKVDYGRLFLKLHATHGHITCPGTMGETYIGLTEIYKNLLPIRDLLLQEILWLSCLSELVNAGKFMVLSFCLLT